MRGPAVGQSVVRLHAPLSSPRPVAESLVVRVLGTAGGGGSTGAVNRGRLTDFHWILPPFWRRRTHGMGKS